MLSSRPGGEGTRNKPVAGSVPQVVSQPIYAQGNALGTTPGASLLPTTTQQSAIPPLANFINNNNSYWAKSAGEAGGVGFSSTLSTLYVSSLVANRLTVNTIVDNAIFTSTITTQLVDTSSINAITINIDNQILTADNNELFLNGLPVATTANLSSIQDWALFDAVSTIRMLNHDITGAKKIQAQTVQTGLTSSILVLTDTSYSESLSFTSSLIAIGAYVSTVLVSHEIDLATTASGYKLRLNTNEGVSRLFANGSTIAYVEDVANWAKYPATSTIQGTKAIVNALDLRGVSSIGELTSDGNQLFFNGLAINTGTTSNLADWAIYPAVSTIYAPQGVYANTGRLKLAGQGMDLLSYGTGLFGSTNTLTIRSGDVNLASDGGGGFNCATGLNLSAGAGFNIAAGAGGAITAGLALAIQAGGAALFSAAGAATVQAGGVCSLAAGGKVNIGASAGNSVDIQQVSLFNSGVISRFANTSPRIQLQDVQSIQGNQTGGGGTGRLDIIGNDVNIQVSSTRTIAIHAENGGNLDSGLAIRCDGSSGTGVGLVPYLIQQEFKPSTQTMTYTSQTANITNTFPPFKTQYRAGVSNVLTNTTTYNTLSQNWDGSNTITYGNTTGTVNITGLTSLTSDVVNATTINTTNLNFPSLSISTIGVSTIVGNNATFNNLSVPNLSFSTLSVSTLAVSTLTANNAIFKSLTLSQSTIRLGYNSATMLVEGNNSIGIGYVSQPTGSNAIGIGYNAGNEGANESVSIGDRSGVLCGVNSVNIGYRANGLAGQARVITINATTAPLDPTVADACFMKPLRSLPSTIAYQSAPMLYNNTTGELTYDSTFNAISVVATSGTAIVLNASMRGRTYILTGTTTQAFTTTSLTTNDTNFFIIVHNGNTTNGGDINISGATGTTIVHNRTGTQNGQNLYLVWSGTQLVGY